MMQSVIISHHLPFPRDQAGLVVPRVVSSNQLTKSIAPNTQVTRKGIKSAVWAHRDDDTNRDGSGNGRMVDEDIITLRLRMKELSMSECENSNELPLEWMEWERNYFGYFQKDVYALVGLLQIALMNTRPCLAIGMLAFLALTVTTSVGLLSWHGIQVVKGILNGLS